MGCHVECPTNFNQYHHFRFNQYNDMLNNKQNITQG